MSNTKEVSIEGTMPFCITDSDKARSWLGFMAAPSFGLRIAYSNHRYIPNERGGKTATYDFTISGIEAVRYELLDEMLKDFMAAGTHIYVAKVRDLDNDGDWETLLGFRN